MAVLVEATSVVLRRASISRSYAGGWDAFVAAVPNATLCYDDDIARVGFLSPSEVERYVKNLQRCGLEFLEHGKYVDVAIVDQRQGLTSKCDWLECGRFQMGAGQMSACWLFVGPRVAAGIHMKSTSMNISTPHGWKFEGSLSQNFQFIPTTDADGGTTQVPSGIQKPLPLGCLEASQFIPSGLEPFEKSNPASEVGEHLKIMGYDLIGYGAAVALLEVQSGYSPVEAASHIALTTMALDIKSGGRDIERLMRIHSHAMALLV